MRSASPISRMPRRWFAPRRAAAFLALGFTGLVLAACSPGGEYPSVFGTAHDMTAPRTDAPLDSTQVQRATEDLISARDRLSAEAQGGQGAQGKNANSPAANSGALSVGQSAAKPSKSAANAPGKSAAKSTGKSAAKSPTKSSTRSAANSQASAPVRKQPGAPVSLQQTLGTEAGQATSPETK